MDFGPLPVVLILRLYMLPTDLLADYRLWFVQEVSTSCILAKAGVTIDVANTPSASADATARVVCLFS
jgi:hypothetical protein